MKKIILLILLICFSFSLEKREYRSNDQARGQLRLEAETNTILSVADTYYIVSGNFVDGDINDFSLSSNGRLTYTGEECVFLLSGASDLEVDKASTVTYSLYKNGALVPTAQTPHTFVSSSKISNISITSLVLLSKDDYIEVWAKSDTEETTITAKTLLVTLWGK